MPVPVREEDLRRLRSLPSGGDGAAAAAAPVIRSQPTPTAQAKRLVKRVIRRAISWYVDPTAQAAAAGAAESAYRRIDARLPAPGSSEDFGVLAINLELLKGELRAMLRSLEDLGQAIAPAAGLAGAATRLAELRERLNDLDRRTRRVQSATVPAPGGEQPAPGPHAEATTAGSRFDYVGFERRFRGESDAITAMQRDRYLDVLRDHASVLDLGCGRGELVGALAAAGVAARGVDLDGESVAEARAQGRDVTHADALEALRTAEPGSLGAIVAIHVVEHLELEPLLELLELAAQRLRPGGVLIAETPNPASLIVLGNSYILDPTHIRPLHPSLLVFLCERAGFRDVRLQFFAPALAYQLPLLSGEDLPPWTAQINDAFGRLNDVLFGPQEYAVIATTPSSAPNGADTLGGR
jgi:2-polyprenyl-3-methyl-5-hydroxy-6-metoxy-1,4-benzoquinol methylase